MGWGIFLTLGSLLVGKTKEYIENKEMMSSPYRHLDDGTPVYLDRDCVEHINGEKLISKVAYDMHGNVYLQQVGKYSGKVYIDPQNDQLKRIDERNNKKMKEYLNYERLAYPKYDPYLKKEFTCEISTGKYISGIYGKEDGTYWKHYTIQNPEYYWDEDKEIGGIQITQEEYDKLDISPPHHHAIDFYRFKYCLVRGQYKLVRRTKEEMQELDKKIKMDKNN